MATTRSRTYSISQTDKDASRLVFVYVKNVKPKRKVAVPVPDSMTWDGFLAQVKTKLRLIGVAEICLASSGQKVIDLTELQDIDELCVTEGPEVRPGSTTPRAGDTSFTAGPAPEQEIAPVNGDASTAVYMGSADVNRHKVGVADTSTGDSNHDANEDTSGKYTKRLPSMRRVLQQIAPRLFSPGLPVSTKDLPEKTPDGRTPLRRRRRRSPFVFSLRNIFLLLAVLSCFGTMAFMLFKLKL